ncbi:hypothetical protein RFI_07952, partial [Reticulomyxa filosa]
VAAPNEDATNDKEESEDGGDDEQLPGDEREGPMALKAEESNKNENASEEKAKPDNEEQPNLKYAHLDLYWENCGTMDLSSKEAKKALLKSSDVEKLNEKQALIPINASTYEILAQGMRDYRSYLIRCKARNKSGWGEYGVPLEILTEKMEIDSKILKPGEKEILVSWLPKKYQGRKLKLLFRASKKAFASAAFHAKCDNKGPTLTVIKAKSGNVFGGFTTVPWGMSNTYRFDKHAFIFLLRKKESKKKKKEKTTKKKRPKDEPPVKWKATNTSNAVYHGSAYGPTFGMFLLFYLVLFFKYERICTSCTGGGFDFYLCSNCNTTGSSYANAGNSYGCPRDQNLLAGTYNFLVAEYEVFELKK